MSALDARTSGLDALAATAAQAKPRVSQLTALAAVAPPRTALARVSQALVLAAFGPPSTFEARAPQLQLLAARSAGASNVSTRTSQGLMLIAYGTGTPVTQVASTWTFVLDGHTFWVVSLGPEGDFAYDKDTKQWCQLITQGFANLNFTHGTMWKTRIIGGDILYPTLYELDPEQPDDEGWRGVLRIVTGGITVRSTNMIGVANFRLTGSLGVISDASTAVNLSFSDDNGITWTTMAPILLVPGQTNTPLVWDALGSFQAPGRIFQVSDTGGMASINGADVALNNFNEDDGSSGPGVAAGSRG